MKMSFCGKQYITIITIILFQNKTTGVENKSQILVKLAITFTFIMCTLTILNIIFKVNLIFLLFKQIVYIKKKFSLEVVLSLIIIYL